MTRACTIERVVGLAIVLLLLAGLATVTSATAQAAATPPPRSVTPFEATLLSCRQSARTESRSASVATAMRPIAGASRLALRVDLYQRGLALGSRWALRADVPGLGVWTPPSDPSIGTRANDVFKYRQTVGRLVVPYAYRFRVAFRWYDAAGAIVREESMVTSPCREPDLRANLVVVRADAAPHPDPQSSRYVVLVRNAGRATAANVGVAVAAVEAPGATRTIRRLLPQETVAVTLVGPACVAGAEPSIVVDPAATVEESDETDNTLVATCPATLDRP